MLLGYDRSNKVMQPSSVVNYYGIYSSAIALQHNEDYALGNQLPSSTILPSPPFRLHPTIDHCPATNDPYRAECRMVHAPELTILTRIPSGVYLLARYDAVLYCGLDVTGA